MPKDPNYDRYAGIVSLPGPDGKMPRPFRVDGDGNVIYRDEEVGAKVLGDRQSRADARAGILDWDELDRRLDARSAPTTQDIVATGVRGSPAGATNGNVATTRKTIDRSDYDVISANTYDPLMSNGKTAIPNADMIATMNASKWYTAVTDAGPEKGAYIIRLPLDFTAKADDGPVSERNLTLTNPKSEMYYSLPSFGAKPGSTRTANTLNFGRKFPIGTVTLGHGHPDGDSDGMIDDRNPSQKPDPVVGDVGSLLRPEPMPMATVSKGRIGWHQLENGRLQFMYPSGTLEKHEVEEIQKKLNLQQSLFHRRGQ